LKGGLHMYSQNTWNPNIQRSWVPCLLRDDDRYVLRAKDVGDDVQTTGDKIYLHYRVPASGFLSNQRLFVDGVRIGLNNADAQNFVSEVMLLGVHHAGANGIWEQNTQMNSQGDHVLPINPAQDLSRFPAADLRITLKSTTPCILRIAYTLVSVSYR